MGEARDSEPRDVAEVHGAPPQTSAQARSPSHGKWALVAGAVASLLAFAILWANIGDVGLWSKAEFPVLNRSRGALGEPFEELLASPWLPDYLRTRALATLGGDAGIRLPHAIATALMVGIASGLARRHSGRWWPTVMTGALALGLPIVLVGGSTIQGNPIAEALGCIAVVAGIASLDRSRTRNIVVRIALGLLALAAITGSVLSCGLLFGAALPLTIVSLCRGSGRRITMPGAMDVGRWASLALGVTAAAVAATALYLTLEQGEGFIPLVGASKDPELVEYPQRRAMTASLREVGYLMFPWGVLGVLGIASPRRPSWAAAWLVLATILAALWSQVYGFVVPPITIPAALVCGAAASDLLDDRRPALLRRLILTVAVIGIAVAAKDASVTPSKVASPLHNLEGEQHYPDDVVGASDRLDRLGKVVIAGLLLAYLVAPSSRRRREDDRPEQDGDFDDPRVEGSPPWLESLLESQRELTRRIPRDLRTSSSHGLLLATILISGVSQDSLLRDTGNQLSARAPLDRHAAWVASGQLPETLAVHRLRDEGVRYYGPPPSNVKTLPGRSDLSEWIAPRDVTDAELVHHVALVRRNDFPFLFQKSRQQGRHLTTLDWSHHDFVLVSNKPVVGIPDVDPLGDVVLDRPTQLENQTKVAFGDYVDLIGWEFEGPVARGKKARLHLMFEVKRPLPTTAKIIARLQKGKMSRINAKPHILAEGKYPGNYWRRGDFIHHRFEFEISRVEALPGEHDFIVALKKSDKGQIKITDPPEGEEDGDFGVKVPGKSHEFATIGTVWVE